MHILIVDDQKSARRAVERILEQLPNVTLAAAATLDEARDVLARQMVDVALIDIRLSDDLRNTDGLTLVREISVRGEVVPICITAAGEMALIREAMRAGAFDYILKDDLCSELIVPVITGLRDRRRLEREVERLRARIALQDMPLLVGASPAIERLRRDIRRVALSDRPVLVTGPTGAGKEPVARTIHALGPAPEQPFLDLNCAALPEALIESQLFGHEKGAFTGADRQNVGYFAAVGNGTLFLDEVGELPLALQAKLLRVLETGRFRPVGTTSELACRGRIVAATHRDLHERVRQGLFREDLYFRLNVIELRVTALDEHRDDIPLLVAHFLRSQRRNMRFSQDALDLLKRMEWPGNVRQLRNVIDRVAVFAEQDSVSADDIVQACPTTPASVADVLTRLARQILQLPVAEKLAAIEDALLAEAMTCAGGNKTAAARILGVHRKAVERRVVRSDASPPDPDDDTANKAG